MQIWEHWIRMQNHWNNTIQISQLTSAYVFYSYWKSGDCAKLSHLSLFHFLVRAPSSDTLYLHLTDRKVGWKEGTSGWSFLFLFVIFSVSGWLRQRSKKGWWKVSLVAYVLRTPLPSLCFLSNFDSKGKYSLWGPHLLSRCNTLTCVFISEDMV